MKRFASSACFCQCLPYLWQRYRGWCVRISFLYRQHCERHRGGAGQREEYKNWRRRYVDAIRTRLNLEQTQLGQLNTILDQTKARFKDLKERQKQRNRRDPAQEQLSGFAEC